MASNECFVCGTNCLDVDDDHPDHPMIGSAVAFNANGNWASGVWDPLDESLSLHILICDECLTKHKDRAEIITNKYTGWERVSRVQFDKWEPKRYTDSSVFKCSCGGPMKAEPAGIDFLIICQKCRRRGPKVQTQDHKQGFKK
jgi:hypothetical protein